MPRSAQAIEQNSMHRNNWRIGLQVANKSPGTSPVDAPLRVDVPPAKERALAIDWPPGHQLTDAYRLQPLRTAILELFCPCNFSLWNPQHV